MSPKSTIAELLRIMQMDTEALTRGVEPANEELREGKWTATER